VPELLLTCLQRYLKDPKGFEAKLSGRSVLMYEPPEHAPTPLGENEDSAAFRFRTASGVTGTAMGGGDPTVAYLEKTKDNAFQRRVTLGRTGNNDIEIDSPSVSRFHAWFVRDEKSDRWTIVDANSKNGTQVAGKKLAPKVPEPLPNGSRVKVGQVELTFFTADGFLAQLKRRGAP
jgi:hypothetical protein